ncbi:MAG: PAS domain S-box protein [Gemmatimonadales bacterium]
MGGHPGPGEQGHSEQLAKLERRYREIFELAPVGIYQSRQDGSFITVNAAFAGILGYDSTDEVLGLNMGRDVYLHPEERLALIEKHREEGSVADLELEVRRKDGTPAWIQLNARVIEDPDGRLLYYEGFVRDIDARKRAEQALRESEQQFRALFEHGMEPMLIIDDDHRILDLNVPAAELFGVAPAEAVGHRFEEFIAPGESREIPGLWRRLMEVGVLDGNFEWHRLDGSVRELEYSAKANFVPGRHLAFVRDVTVQRELEAQVRQSQKLEAVGALAGGLAHDFNNIMTAIIGYADLLLEELPADLPHRQDAHEIRAAADRAAALTRQLLAFSRRQVLQPRILNLNTVVAGLEKMLGRLIGEHIRFETVLSPDLGRVSADPGQLEQVIMNLVINARDAMPGGGRLTVATMNVEHGEPQTPQDRLMPAGQYVLLSVSDTGAGMDAATRARIFEPFFSTKGMGQGTGLGLATVYGIVKQSNGFIWVISEPGQGATFRVYLPRVDNPLDSPAAPPPPREASGGTETILLVEDEPSVLTIARTALRRAGYSVLHAPDGESAMALEAVHRGRIHLLLTDVVMPGMNGRELAERVRSRRPEARVLYMTGYTGDAIAREGILDPAVAYLEKPFTAADLLVKVREVLESEK